MARTLRDVPSCAHAGRRGDSSRRSTAKATAVARDTKRNRRRSQAATRGADTSRTPCTSTACLRFLALARGEVDEHVFADWPKRLAVRGLPAVPIRVFCDGDQPLRIALGGAAEQTTTAHIRSNVGEAASNCMRQAS